MIQKISFAVLLMLMLYLVFCGSKSTRPQLNRIDLLLPSSAISRSEVAEDISIAFLADLHVDESPESLSNLEALILSVAMEKPDLVIFGGDFVDGSVGRDKIGELRTQIATLLGTIEGVSLVAVLGNHDSWTDPVAWTEALNSAGVSVIDGRVATLGYLNLCVRGLGDVYSGKYSYVDFPQHCLGMTRISVTHDPAGAFKPRVEGLVLAGHTHCGQIRLPIIGAPWAPTDAPQEAQCGLYEDPIRTVFVSSGIGTSLLPFRIGAQSQWDLIRLMR